MNYRKIKSLILLFLILPIFISATELDLSTRLAGLAKVWGFLKYHHSAVAAGNFDWDNELVAIIPDVKAATDFTSYNEMIEQLITRAGVVRVMKAPTSGTVDQNTDTNSQWINNTSLFNWRNRSSLTLLKMSPRTSDNYYVQTADVVGNPLFDNEIEYRAPEFPNEEYRLLALFRYWNIIHYFFPYKDVIGSNWEDILEEFIPRLIEASTTQEYHLLVREFTARINDSHSLCMSTPIFNYYGDYYSPFEVTYIDGETVVIKVLNDLPGIAGTIEVGDVVITLNGQDINEKRQEMRRYQLASNEISTQRNISYYLFDGPQGPFTVEVQRGDQKLTFTLNRITVYELNAPRDKVPPVNWKLLPGNIGYVHMGVLVSSDVPLMMDALQNTKAIIFDIRNYPNRTIYTLANYLNPDSRPFVKFTKPDLDNPGSFFTQRALKAGPMGYNSNYYKGKVIVLMNEQTQSQAEFTCMALQTAPQATLIGRQTAGADGNVSEVYLPGGIRTIFTATGVFYPDGRPTQRIGIVPDIEIHPTVEGIRQGRDEVLETAISFINQD